MTASTKTWIVLLIAAGIFLDNQALMAGIRDEDAPADAEAAVERAAAEIVDLTPYYSGGLAPGFAKSTRYPWSGVPRGFQTFANVPLDIGGRICLWGERNATINGQIFPEKAEGIALNRNVETLYVYHCAFFESEEGAAVYDLVFQYDDGTSATDTLRYGDDVRDWYGRRGDEHFGPTGDRSVLAWDSDGIILGGLNGADRIQPLRFCLTAIANPHPGRKVKSIDLVSSKSTSAGCILAMTLGKPTLMRKAK